MARKSTKRVAKQAVKAIKKSPITALVLAIILIIVAVLGYFAYKHFYKKGDSNNSPVVAQVSGQLSFHFIALGNGESGDCTYIKAGDNDILIDAGSDYDSKQSIMDYINTFVTDNKLEYVIATHAHLDHIACFAGEKNGESLFDEYEVGTIIDFPKTNSTTAVYNRYVAERQAEIDAGAKHYTAFECFNNLNGGQRVYSLNDDGSLKMEILDNPYYKEKTTNENNYSVCLQFWHGDRAFLFTGDLEEIGEQYLVEKNDLSQVELYKAGHHGSSTASNDCLLEVIKPKIVVISGSADDKYSFPHQQAINRIARYTSQIYMTTLSLSNGYQPYNGNVVVSSDATNGVGVSCSNIKEKLKDTDWFKSNRTWPNYGVS